MRRLREEFGLEPVEYPTTRRLDSSPQDRAADLMAAFADPGIRAVLATIGGDDQITVLPHLDPGVVVACPNRSPYTDNTNLLNWLWNLGVPSYHGGSTMVHLGRGGRLHPASSGSLRAALIDGGDLDLRPAEVIASRHRVAGAVVPIGDGNGAAGCEATRRWRRVALETIRGGVLPGIRLGEIVFGGGPGRTPWCAWRGG